MTTAARVRAGRGLPAASWAARARVPALLAAAFLAGPPLPAGGSGDATTRGLVWYVEAADGSEVASRGADEPINPASLVKLATTWMALERLGADHRFETRFAARGAWDADAAALDGDLIVHGGGDPDFHVENAALVAEALAALGLREVRGDLLVDDRFWIGWEGGSAGREVDPERRAGTMAARLRDALDPQRRDAETRQAVAEMRRRRGESPGAPERGVRVRGSVGRLVGAAPERPLLVHRSNPLRLTLKRFNAYSNNDIERLSATLGPASALGEFLERRLASPVRIETLSGLGTNRMTPRQIVRMLDGLRETCRRFELRLADVLPAIDCDPGTLAHYPALREAGLAGALVAKTGTLTRTDGGVSALAGLLDTAGGERTLCVAVPGLAGGLAAARRAQQSWLLRLVADSGGARAGACGAPVALSDREARLTPR